VGARYVHTRKRGWVTGSAIWRLFQACSWVAVSMVWLLRRE
jgi:hypothetical protein